MTYSYLVSIMQYVFRDDRKGLDPLATPESRSLSNSQGSSSSWDNTYMSKAISHSLDNMVFSSASLGFSSFVFYDRPASY